MPALINTVIMTFLFADRGAAWDFSAIFLVEYAETRNKFVEVIRLTTETLSGIPSIVYGLFGMLFLSIRWMGIFSAGRCVYTGDHDPSADHENNRRSVKSGSGFLTGREALGWEQESCVPYFGLYFRLQYRNFSGSHSGDRTNCGRDSGADLYSRNCWRKCRPAFWFRAELWQFICTIWSSEGLYMDQAYATAVILLVLVVGINTISSVIAKKLDKSITDREKMKDKKRG